jgi:hypothetical protein
MASLFRSKAASSVALAALVVCMVNAWVAVRLPMLTLDTTLRHFTQLDAQVKAYPHKEQVEVLVLGNSHAVAGLRVPVLARAFGVAPEQCFSFAVASLSAREQFQLVRRYKSYFPRARMAVCAVDPFLFMFHHDPRLRYLTRDSWRARWASAASTPKLETQVQMVLGWWFPLMDYAGLLRTYAGRNGLAMASRLVKDAPLPDAERARTYPWGVPPEWDGLSPERLETLRRTQQKPKAIRVKTDYLLGQADQAAANRQALTETLRLLDAGGVTPHLVEVPLERRMMTLMQRPPFQKRYQAYRASLQASVLGGRPLLQPAPEGWDRQYFHDEDHLNPEGAARLAEAIAATMPRLGER